MPSLFEGFRKGRDAAFAERGFGNRQQPARQTDSDAGRDTTATDDNTRLLTEVTELADQLQKQVGELEGQRDEAKQLLADVVAEAEPRQQRTAELERELEDNKKLLSELAAQAEALQAHIDEIKTERDLFVELLELPGVHRVLVKALSPDTHRDATAEQQLAFTEWSKKVNCVFR